MLLLLLGRLFLLTPSSFWNLPSFTVEFTLSSPCSRSDPPLSRQRAALAHLDSLPLYDLVFWTRWFCSFSFSASPVWLSFFAEAAPFCKLFAGLSSTSESSTPYLFSSSLTLVLSSSPCPLLHLFFYLNLWQELSYSCSIKLQWVPGHWFLPGNDAVDELSRRGALLAFSLSHPSYPLFSFLGLEAYCLI